MSCLAKLRLVGQANPFHPDGEIYHVTHRCCNQASLLQFSRDRDAYRDILRQPLEEFEV